MDEKTKKRRLQVINKLAAEHALARRQRYLGRLEEVLVEQRNVKDPRQVERHDRSLALARARARARARAPNPTPPHASP